MELEEAIEARRTIRDFDDRPIDPAIVEAALEAAFKAPSYDHMRRWEFIFLKDRSARLAVLDAEGAEDLEINASDPRIAGMHETAAAMYVDANLKQRRMVLEAPEVAALVFSIKRRVDEARRIADVNCVAAAWCCIENFMLSLAGRGVLGVTQVLGDTDAVKAALCIPESYDIAALISFGYPSPRATRPRQNELRIAEHIHIDRWRKGHDRKD